MQYTNESNYTFIFSKTNPIVTHPDTIIASLCLKFLKIANIQKTFSTLNFFDHSFDFYQQILVSNFGKIFLKTFSKLNFHPFGSNS